MWDASCHINNTSWSTSAAFADTTEWIGESKQARFIMADKLILRKCFIFIHPDDDDDDDELFLWHGWPTKDV